MDVGQRGQLRRRSDVKRALLVGIDEYDNFPNLGGCINDVHALNPLFARHEDDSPNFECRALASDTDRAGRDQLLREIDDLLAPGAEVAVLYFAGHGTPSDSDVTLVTQDGTDRSPGVALSEILGIAQQSSVQEILLLLDCCFSGGAGGAPQLGSKNAILRGGLAIITASRSDQTSAETLAGRGLFSTFLEGAIDAGAADVLGKVTLAGTYAYLSESFGAWEQRPTMKANVTRPLELRSCAPAVPLAELRALPTMFPKSDHHFRLDSSYEPTAEPRNEANERIFAVLQRCRAAKMVEPVGEDHLYFAAMNDKACRLTPLGRHYRHMADRGWL